MLGSAEPHVLTVLFLFFILSSIHFGDADYEACSESTRTIVDGEIGNTQLIVAPLGTGDRKKNCKIMLKSCDVCQLEISVESFAFQRCSDLPFQKFQSGCSLRCKDYITLHEPNYPTTAYSYVYNSSKSNVLKFTSITKMVYMEICLSSDEANFTLRYTVREKSKTITGSVGQTNSLSSVRFPNGYLGSQDSYIYKIESPDPSAKIRLWFTDWNMYNSSKLTIVGGDNGTLVRYGNGNRPFVQSKDSTLQITFETGPHRSEPIAIGFRAEFNITRQSEWMDKPSDFGCGAYYMMRWGGDFALPIDQCPLGALVDCVWVVNRYQIITHNEYVWLQIYDVRLDHSDVLEIRSGNNSQGSSLKYSASTVTVNENAIELDAFYIHLRVTCRRHTVFKVVFASYDNAERDPSSLSYYCPYEYHYMCQNRRCVASWLRCDTKNHCGDWSDERHCTDSENGVPPCQNHYPCDDMSGYYCSSTKCDNKYDCKDGSDEKECWHKSTTSRPSGKFVVEHRNYFWGTITPVVLICLILGIIACVVISYYVRRKRILRERSRNLHRARANVIGEGTVEGILPPSYEEVISASYVPSHGSINFAFDNCPTDLPVLPPPYSPKLEEYPPYHVPQTSGATPTSQVASRSGPRNEPPPVTNVPARVPLAPVALDNSRHPLPLCLSVVKAVNASNAASNIQPETHGCGTSATSSSDNNSLVGRAALTSMVTPNSHEENETQTHTLGQQGRAGNPPKTEVSEVDVPQSSASASEQPRLREDRASQNELPVNSVMIEEPEDVYV